MLCSRSLLDEHLALDQEDLGDVREGETVVEPSRTPDAACLDAAMVGRGDFDVIRLAALGEQFPEGQPPGWVGCPWR
jgi:hypothetical protein